MSVVYIYIYGHMIEIYAAVNSPEASPNLQFCPAFHQVTQSRPARYAPQGDRTVPGPPGERRTPGD